MAGADAVGTVATFFAFARDGFVVTICNAAIRIINVIPARIIVFVRSCRCHESNPQRRTTGFSTPDPILSDSPWTKRRSHFLISCLIHHGWVLFRIVMVETSCQLVELYRVTVLGHKIGSMIRSVKPIENQILLRELFGFFFFFALGVGGSFRVSVG